MERSKGKGHAAESDHVQRLGKLLSGFNEQIKKLIAKLEAPWSRYGAAVEACVCEPGAKLEALP